MKRGVVAYVLISLVLVSSAYGAQGTTGEDCNLCFFYEVPGQTGQEQCVPFGDDLNTDLIHGINGDFRWHFTVRGCPAEIDNSCNICTRYGASGRSGTQLECTPFGQTRTHTFTSPIGNGHIFDIKMECQAGKLAGYKFCRRYEDLDGRIAASWECFRFGGEATTDFKGGVDGNDDFDIRVQPLPAAWDVLIPYATQDGWSIKEVQHGCNNDCDAPRPDNDGNSWRDLKYSREKEFDDTETPIGWSSCGIPEQDVIASKIPFRKLYVRRAFTLQDQINLRLKYGVDNKITCYLNGDFLFSGEGKQNEGKCGYSVEFTKDIPKEKTLKGDNVIACEVDDDDGGASWFDMSVEAKHIEPVQPDTDKSTCTQLNQAWLDPSGPCCGDDKDDAGKVEPTSQGDMKCTVTSGKGKWVPADADKNKDECDAVGGLFVNGAGCCGDDKEKDNGVFFGSSICQDGKLTDPTKLPFQIMTINGVDYVSNGEQFAACGGFGNIPLPSSGGNDARARASKFFCAYRGGGSTMLECCVADATDERKCQNAEAKRVFPGETILTLNRGFTQVFKKAEQFVDIPLSFPNWKDGNALAVSFMATQDTSIEVEVYDTSNNLLFTKPLTKHITGLVKLNRFMVAYIPLSSQLLVSKLRVVFRPTDKKKVYSNQVTIGRVWLSATTEYICSAAKHADELKSPWLTDYDTSTEDANSEPAGKSACNTAKGFGWTGTQCCGDDKSENYVDGDNGCKNGVPVGDGTILDTENKIVFFQKQQWVCGRKQLSVVLPPPLVHWSFDDVNDVVVPDGSGNVPATLVNNPVTNDDAQMQSKVLVFDGNDDYVRTDKELGLMDKNAFSVDFLIKTHQGLPESEADSRTVMQVQGASFGGKSSHAYFSIVPKGLRMGWWADHDPATGTGGNDWKLETPIPLSEWIHVTAVWKRDGNKVHGTLYVNGEEKGSKQSGLLTFQNFKSYPILGATSWQTNAGYFNGALDEVRIWNTMLTNEHVTELYNRYTTTRGLPSTDLSVNFCAVKGDYFCSIIDQSWSDKPSLASASAKRTAVKQIPPSINLIKNGGFEEIR